MTPEGIFLIYNGADDKLVYSTGWVLFDKKDPTKFLRALKSRYSRRKRYGKRWGKFRMSYLWKA